MNDIARGDIKNQGTGMEQRQLEAPVVFGPAENHEMSGQYYEQTDNAIILSLVVTNFYMKKSDYVSVCSMMSECCQVTGRNIDSL